MRINLRLKELREEKGLNQKEIASKIGLARQTYNHYEVQENVIPLKHLNSLANYYDVSIDYILDLNTNKRYSSSIKDINVVVSGNRLKEFRKEINFTQKKMANFLNIDQPTWSIYENGKSFIGTPFLYQICLKYNVSADYLLGKIDSPKNI